MLVIDASIAACWLLEDEESTVANNVLEETIIKGAAVPALFWYELKNVLLMSWRGGRIDEQQIAAGLKMIRSLPLNTDFSYPDEHLLSVAKKYTLTVYDAAYLELAMRLSFPLYTLDKKLKTAFEETRTC